MLTGINIGETKKYISRFDPDKENPTVFHIGILDAQVKDRIEDEATSFAVSSSMPNDNASVSVNFNRRNYLMLQFGLKNVENFNDPGTGKPLRFETIAKAMGGKSYNVVTDEILSMLPSRVRKELAEEIMRENTLSDDEIKN